MVYDPSFTEFRISCILLFHWSLLCYLLYIAATTALHRGGKLVPLLTEAGAVAKSPA